MYRHSLIFFFLSLLQLISARVLPGNPQAIRTGTTPAFSPPTFPGTPQAIRTGTTPAFPHPTFPGFCNNAPTARQCWTPGFDISTDVENFWPHTGRVVSYALEVQNLTLAPDGTSRPVYGINGQFPGPTIRANWGDTLKITVKNGLTVNGTSIHWHGLRQWRSNPMDGTNGITECPLAPGESRTYTFLATQYGTSWYHSHHATQYSDGVWGTIVIDGPATSNYDLDLGTLPISDWFHETSASIVYKLARGQLRGPPPGDNILINGTNVNPSGTGGAYARTTLQKGKTHRLRLVNTATNDGYYVSLDNHNMTVISMDFVPIVPYTTDWLYIGVGQRYDVLINATQTADSYWFHAVPGVPCGNNVVSNGLSIFTYSGANTTTPSNSTRSRGPPTLDCSDANAKLFPYVAIDVPNEGTIPQSSVLNVSFNLASNSSSYSTSVVQWNLNFSAIRAPWDKPTLEYVRESNFSFPSSMNVIRLPDGNNWTYWVVQAVPGIAPPEPHPIHLHGHNFYLLGAGTGTYSSAASLNFANPPRRDVAMLPAGGYLVLAFKTDNPGAWLMHCHIAWHVDFGFGAQFLEGVSQIPPLLASSAGWNQQCSSWDQYEETAPYSEDLSGL